MFIRKEEFRPFEKKIYISSPTMHGDELKYMTEAYETNWMSSVGENINAVEKIAAERAGVNYAVALSSGTAALHLCLKLAGEKIYGRNETGHGVLSGKKVLCSDLTFVATVNPILYEGGIPIFIDSDINSWNMDPNALEKAFEIYPDVKIVVYAELYGFPGNISRIKSICEKHGALLIEDAAESMGATWDTKQCGSFGDYSALSYNGNKIITGSAGGCLLTNSSDEAKKALKLSTQSRESASWYEHKDIGYNYRMSNVVAGVIRGQYNYLDEHIRRKKEIYERYREAFISLPVHMNPFDEKHCVPNYWMNAMIIDKEAMCRQHRDGNETHYVSESGKSCPCEISEAVSYINAESRPVMKPMHMQPMFNESAFVQADGQYDVGEDIFERAVCLPCDNKMTEENQKKIIEVVNACFE